MAVILKGQGGNCADYTEIDGEQVWLSAELDERALARMRAFESFARNATSYLSFEDRVRWAESDVVLADAVSVARQ